MWRLLSFLLVLSLVTALGWLFKGWPGATAAALLVSVLWALVQTWLAARYLAWLRADTQAQPPRSLGNWAEAADRSRRLLVQWRRQNQESHNRLQDFLAAIQASPYGVVLLNAQGSIEWCNLTSSQHLGFEPVRDRMQYIANLLREPAFVSYWNKRDFSHEVKINGRDSDSSHARLVAVQVHPYGQGRHVLLTRDVTAVEQAEAMRRDFVANVSHEIRTPLTVLAGFIETLQTLPLDDPERERYLALMAQQSERMQVLVQDLLTLSRLEGSPPPGLGEWIQVAGLTARCIHEGRALSDLLLPADELRHAFELSLPRDELEISGAMTEIQSALSNLVSNAVRYTPAGGTIRMAWCVLDDGRAQCVVSDTGAGIASQHIPRLTERFYRVDRSRSRESGGTGLGLAIVKHVVQRHGGELQIESTVGKGSSFSIRFPAHRVRQEASDSVRHAAPVDV